MELKNWNECTDIEQRYRAKTSFNSCFLLLWKEYFYTSRI